MKGATRPASTIHFTCYDVYREWYRTSQVQVSQALPPRWQKLPHYIHATIHPHGRVVFGHGYLAYWG